MIAGVESSSEDGEPNLGDFELNSEDELLSEWDTEVDIMTMLARSNSLSREERKAIAAAISSSEDEEGTEPSV